MISRESLIGGKEEDNFGMAARIEWLHDHESISLRESVVERFAMPL
jgi:hypothetical protein